MRLRTLFVLVALLGLVPAGAAHANSFIGDLVYCDDNANGRFDEGEMPLDGVAVDVACYVVQPNGDRDECIARTDLYPDGFPGWDGHETTVETGQMHGSILDSYGAFNGSCGDEAGYDPLLPGQHEGRYIVRVPDCTEPYVSDRIECVVDVDEVASAAALGSCNVQVTPMADGFPLDNNGDGDFCDAEDPAGRSLADGPFPEDQLLGNLPSRFTPDPFAACNRLPDLPPGDGVYHPVIQYAGGDLCSLNNDFGYTPDGAVCDLEVEKSCLVLPPPSQGDDCQGKVRRAVFQYTGESCDALDNLQEGKAACLGDLPGDHASVVITKDPDKIFATPEDVSLGGTFEVVKLDKGQLKDFPSELKFDLVGDSTQSIKLHTSCSKPLAVGDVFGGVRLVELETTEGGVTSLGPDPADLTEGFASCEIPSAEGLECEEKPSQISLRYVGGECSVGNSQEGKASCDGVVADADPARLFFTNKDGKKIFEDSLVDLGDVVVVTNRTQDDADSDKFDSDSRVRLYDGANRLIQDIRFHTSCSKPLRVGDRFGALEVVGFVDPKLGSVESGADVVLFWELHNGGSALTNVTLRDDQLDPMDVPGTPLASMEPGATLHFRETLRVDGPGTGTVVAQATSTSGDSCRDSASVEILVAEPPPEPFVCSDAKPIAQLSLVWTGPSGVDVVTESGETFLDVQNGDEIEIDVLGLGNDVDLSVSGAESGNSRFHVSCSDSAMNGPEDCGSLQGNSKNDDSGFLNLWRFEGMAGDLALDCSAL